MVNPFHVTLYHHLPGIKLFWPVVIQKAKSLNKTFCCTSLGKSRIPSTSSPPPSLEHWRLDCLLSTRKCFVFHKQPNSISIVSPSTRLPHQVIVQNTGKRYETMGEHQARLNNDWLIDEVDCHCTKVYEYWVCLPWQWLNLVEIIPQVASGFVLSKNK